MTGTVGTPLPRKLGVRDGSALLLDGLPSDLADLAAALGPLPETATVHRRARLPSYDVVVVLCRDHARLAERWPALAPRVTTAGRLWVCWPKRASGRQEDLDDGGVREWGRSHGLVDVKVCALDATWSGQAFVRRVRDR